MSTVTQGSIIYFNQDRGFGSIQSDAGEVFLLIKNLADLSQATQLQPGTLVQFRTVVRKHKVTGEDQLVAQEVAVVVANDAPALNDAPSPSLEATAIEPPLRRLGLTLAGELLGQVGSAGFSKKLVKTLALGLGPIEGEGQYAQAQQLIKANEATDGVHWEKLNRALFAKAAPAYQLRMWREGLHPACDYILIENAYLKGTAAQRDELMARCTPEQQSQLAALQLPGAGQQELPNGEVEVYFSGIRDVILSELRGAKKCIKVAVAWFTSHDLFDALCQRVQDGLDVQLVVLNDPINNWTGGLNFQEFIELGRERANSHLYFSEPDQRLLHHKFCLIDDEVLLNGSYNWTYYAEGQNIENCTVVRNQPAVVSLFGAEFDRLTHEMVEVVQVVPFGETVPLNRDTHRAAVYRSNDLVAQATTVGLTRRGLVAKLVRQALVLNPENEEAQRLQRKASAPQGEQALREQGIATSLEEIATQRQQLQQKTAAEQAQAQQQALAAAARAAEQTRQQQAQALELERERQQQAEQQQRLQAERQALEAKQQLEAAERQRLQAVAEEESEAARRQERIAQERRDNEEAARQQQQEAAKQQRETQRQNEAAAAQRATVEQDLAEKEASLKASKGVKMQGGRGELRINLAWKTLDDLDLHVYDPDGNHICYSAKQATCQDSLGVLDIDANAGTPKTRTPQENIFWKESPPEGTYRVEVNNYTVNEKEACPFVVTLIPGVGEPKVLVGKTKAVKTAVEVVEFTYSAEQGLQMVRSI